MLLESLVLRWSASPAHRRHRFRLFPFQTSCSGLETDVGLTGRIKLRKRSFRLWLLGRFSFSKNDENHNCSKVLKRSTFCFIKTPLVPLVSAALHVLHQSQPFNLLSAEQMFRSVVLPFIYKHASDSRSSHCFDVVLYTRCSS